MASSSIYGSMLLHLGFNGLIGTAKMMSRGSRGKGSGVDPSVHRSEVTSFDPLKVRLPKLLGVFGKVSISGK